VGGFLRMTAVCEIFSVKEWCDLENRVRIRSRSLEMAPFDRSHTTSHTSVRLSARSCIPSKRVNIIQTSASVKLTQTRHLHYKTAFPRGTDFTGFPEGGSKSRYLQSETGLGFVQGHWKWHHLIDRIRVPILLP